MSAKCGLGDRSGLHGHLPVTSLQIKSNEIPTLLHSAQHVFDTGQWVRVQDCHLVQWPIVDTEPPLIGLLLHEHDCRRVRSLRFSNDARFEHPCNLFINNLPLHFRILPRSASYRFRRRQQNFVLDWWSGSPFDRLAPSFRVRVDKLKKLPPPFLAEDTRGRLVFPSDFILHFHLPDNRCLVVLGQR